MNSLIGEANKKCIEKLSDMGCEGFQVATHSTEFDEISYDSGKFTLMRSGDEDHLNVKVLKDSKTGSVDTNDLTSSTLEKSCDQAVALTESATADEAHGFSKDVFDKSFEAGPDAMDRDQLYDKMEKFVAESSKIENLKIRNVTARFQTVRSQMENNFGVKVAAKKSFYTLSLNCSASRGEKSGSMNYDSLSFVEFPTDFLDYFGPLLQTTAEQLDCKKNPEKFEGQIILTPKCAGTFLSMLLGHLGNAQIISKTSRWLGKIDEKVLSEKITVRSRPQKFPVPTFVTEDLIETKDLSIIEKGVLKTYLLDLYGANKSGVGKISNFGQRPEMAPGEKSLTEIISTVKNGILVDRFSGGNPNINGDFSGIAKNSYLIKDGKLAFPLQETMISGNLFSLFSDVDEVSQETRNNGTSSYPWVLSSGIVVS